MSQTASTHTHLDALRERRWSRAEMAVAVASDIPDGASVNLGIGLPTDVAAMIDVDKEVVFHSENGILGMGQPPVAGAEDWDLIDAGKRPVTLVAGGSYTSHADSFALIRSGRLDLCVLGAFQVSAGGDLANWSVPGATIPAVGGAMDLAIGARQVWVMMNLCGRDTRVKLVLACSYPLTAPAVVTRLYTDLGILRPRGDRFELISAPDGVTVDDVACFADAPIVTGAE